MDELSDLLAATDVFVTPYANREQIASGALTFAIAAGCGVVSTPYWYARDMLESGAGTLVPFNDPAAFATAIGDYIEHPDKLAAARAESRRIGSGLAWPSVAEATAAVLDEAFASAPRPPKRPIERFARAIVRGWMLETFVQHHRDVRSELPLDVDGGFGRQQMLAAVEMRAERRSFFVHLAPRRKTEHLVAATISKDRLVPADECMEASERADALGPGPQI